MHDATSNNPRDEAAGGRIGPRDRMRELTAEQREALWRDGYVIIRAAVPRSLTGRARAAIEAAEREGASPLGLGADRSMTDLVNHPASAVGDILRTTIGRFDPPTACQVAVRPVSQPSDNFVAPGYRERDLPYHGGAAAPPYGRPGDAAHAARARVGHPRGDQRMVRIAHADG